MKGIVICAVLTVISCGLFLSTGQALLTSGECIYFIQIPFISSEIIVPRQSRLILAVLSLSFLTADVIFLFLSRKRQSVSSKG